MQHEMLTALAFYGIDNLGIPVGSERYHDQCLGFTAGKQRRTMRPRENTHINGNLPDFFRSAPVYSWFPGQDPISYNIAFQSFNNLLDFVLLPFVRMCFLHGMNHFGPDLRQPVPAA